MIATQSTLFLKKYFGYDSFKSGQEELIANILQGRDVLGVMPTGAGKSVCYQIPAAMLPGVTLVVSPLISLMKDQVDTLQQIGIPTTFINSTLNAEELRERFRDIKAGKYTLVYVAPERLESERFLALLEELPVPLLAVDEAHCVSQWGHDFRPDYFRLGDAARWLGARSIVASTATATPQVAADIEAGRLQTVLEEFAAPVNAIHAVFPQRKHLPLRVRMFVDYLKNTYGDPAYWRG